MAKKLNKNYKNKHLVSNNCVLKVVKQNGYINFSLDIDDIKDVKVRLLVPNVKLASKIYYKLKKIN